MTVRTCFLLYYNFCLWNYVKELDATEGLSRASGDPVPSFAAAKVQQFRKPAKLYTTFFEKKLKITNHIPYCIYPPSQPPRGEENIEGPTLGLPCREGSIEGPTLALPCREGNIEH